MNEMSDQVLEEIRALYKGRRSEDFGPWQGGGEISQREVDVFTGLTGDDNGIHKVGGEQPILPGLFMLAILPRLFPGGVSDFIPNRRVLMKAICCEFNRGVPVGTQLWMRYRVIKLDVDRISHFFEIEFQLGFAGHGNLPKPSASGKIELRIL